MNIISAHDLAFKNFIFYPTIDIVENKTNFILGKSGTGKTTLFKLFNETLSSSQGTILYKNKNIAEYDTIQLRKEVILCSQSLYLFPGTIKENFTQFYKLRNFDMPSDSEISKILSLCCLEKELDTSCDILSGGEKQRVFIAIALMLKPTVLLLDEPTSMLDKNTAFNLIFNIKKYCTQNNITTVIICHDTSLANEYADKIITLDAGVNV